MIALHKVDITKISKL